MSSLPQLAPLVSAEMLSPRHVPRGEVPGLYVHIPFCFHKCHYCDFYSITRQTEQRMTQFVDRILREAEMWARDQGPNLRPRTVFFGGGTPTLLPLETMRRLIVGLRERVDLADVDEWTVEANPATVSLEYCRMLCECGVDRISFGAQSFDRAELAMLERHHDPDDVPRSLGVAREAGFARTNVDLIFAIPGQDMASWSRSLESAIALGTKHISCYALTYEPNTPMAVKKRLGQLTPAAEELELQMLHHTRRRLGEAGYEPYEISNFARPGEACRHNLLYWTGGSYIGLGPSAASHVHGTRWRNRPHLREWEQAIDAASLPSTDVETLSPSQRASELAMLMLRLEQGLDFAAFTSRSGVDARLVFAETIARLHRLALIEVHEDRLRLTESGLNLADAIAAEFLQSPAS